MIFNKKFTVLIFALLFFLAQSVGHAKDKVYYPGAILKEKGNIRLVVSGLRLSFESGSDRAVEKNLYRIAVGDVEEARYICRTSGMDAIIYFPPENGEKEWSVTMVRRKSGSGKEFKNQFTLNSDQLIHPFSILSDSNRGKIEEFIYYFDNFSFSIYLRGGTSEEEAIAVFDELIVLFRVK